MQTLKLLVLFLGAGFSPAVSLFSVAQQSQQSHAAKTTVNWITLEEAADKLEKEKRPLIIDLYTDWCGWCKVMDKKTYNNKKVGDYLNQHFYAVKINAENRNSIIWKGKKYAFNPNYRAHNFALFLTSGNLSYPTTVIIPADGSAAQPIPGYLEPRDLELIVKYFGEGGFEKIPFIEYQQKFKAAW